MPVVFRKTPTPMSIGVGEREEWTQNQVRPTAMMIPVMNS